MAAFGSLWVVNHRGNSLSRIDPNTNKVIATVKTGGGLIGVLRVRRSLFTLDWQNQELLRIDPMRNRVVDEIPVGLEGGGFAYFADLIWIGSRRGENGVLLAIDPKGARVVKRFTYPQAGFINIGVAAGKLWAGTTAIGTVDLETGEFSEQVELEDEWIDLVESGGALWVSYLNHAFISRVDPTTMETTRIQIPDTVVIGETDLEPIPEGVAWRVGNKGIAVVSRGGDIVRFFEGLPQEGFPGGNASGFGSYWVTVPSANEVWRMSLVST